MLRLNNLSKTTQNISSEKTAELSVSKTSRSITDEVETSLVAFANFCVKVLDISEFKRASTVTLQKHFVPQ